MILDTALTTDSQQNLSKYLIITKMGLATPFEYSRILTIEYKHTRPHREFWMYSGKWYFAWLTLVRIFCNPVDLDGVQYSAGSEISSWEIRQDHINSFIFSDSPSCELFLTGNMNKRSDRCQICWNCVPTGLQYHRNLKLMSALCSSPTMCANLSWKPWLVWSY